MLKLFEIEKEKLYFLENLLFFDTKFIPKNEFSYQSGGRNIFYVLLKSLHGYEIVSFIQ